MHLLVNMRVRRSRSDVDAEPGISLVGVGGPSRGGRQTARAAMVHECTTYFFCAVVVISRADEDISVAVAVDVPRTAHLGAEIGTESLLQLARVYRGNMEERDGWGWHDTARWELYFKTLHDIGRTREPVGADSYLTNDLVEFSDVMPTLAHISGAALPDVTLDGHSFWPQCQGQKGNPRQWIYCFYARNGGLEGQEFVRNQRYKLYRNGDFFDVANDDREKNRLAVGALTRQQQEIHAKLKSALAQFQDARPAAVAEVGEAIKRKQQEKKANKKSAQ